MNELLFFLLFFLLNFVSLLQCSHNYCMQFSDFVSLQGKTNCTICMVKL